MVIIRDKKLIKVSSGSYAFVVPKALVLAGMLKLGHKYDVVVDEGFVTADKIREEVEDERTNKNSDDRTARNIKKSPTMEQDND